MKLRFICSESFGLATNVCRRIQQFLPRLVTSIEIVRTDVFTGTFQLSSVPRIIERTAEPDWEQEIVFVVIDGSLYLADLELYEVAFTLERFTLESDGSTRPLSVRPKLGGLFLPNNMSDQLRMDVDYWAKAGVEEILHCFGIPEHHDEHCFFHSKNYGDYAVEDSRLGYCLKCREFMLQLEAPIDHVELHSSVDDIYDRRRPSG